MFLYESQLYKLVLKLVTKLCKALQSYASVEKIEMFGGLKPVLGASNYAEMRLKYKEMINALN